MNTQKSVSLRKTVSAIEVADWMMGLRCATSLLEAVHIAVDECSMGYQSYSDALFGVINCFWKLRDDLEKIVYEEVSDHE
ncbi:MAG: hypothetical protein ACI4JC_10615 [Faecalibacterium sp.]